MATSLKPSESTDSQVIAFRARVASDPLQGSESGVSQPISDRCHDRLQAAGYAELRHLQCSPTSDGVILEGFVSSFFNKQLAQEAIRSIEGVGRVSNRVEVQPELFEVRTLLSKH